MNVDLDDAYGRLHRYGPEYGGDEQGDNGLTNHGPMAVEVLVRRDVGVDLDRWLDRYVRRLSDVPPPGDPIAPDWASALGRPDRLPDWTRHFAGELRERPWRDVLTLWWPRLLPGIVAGATHGVIRVGHAVRALGRESGATGPALTELAHGLAFWAARYRPLRGLTDPAGDRRPDQALGAVTRLDDRAGLIAARLDRLQNTATWTSDLRRLRAPDGEAEVLTLLDDLVAGAVGLYARFGYGSPVLLVHTATAPNAVRHVLPSLPVELWRPSLTAAWAASAAVMAMYAPPDPQPWALPASLTADDVLARAADHGDEHVLKFADTALDAYDRGHDPALLAAAVRAGDLIASPHH